MDVSQDVIIRQDDCGTEDAIEVPVILPDGQPNRSSLIGRVVATETKIGRVKLEKGEEITGARLRQIADAASREAGPGAIPVRTVLKCRAPFGVCRQCYGWSMATGEMSEIGDAVGTVAAQSIGEPGTQLTMRTFHTGGVAGADITHGLPRVVELFEARKPKAAATLSEIGGRVEVQETDRGWAVLVHTKGEDGEPEHAEYAFPRRTRLRVSNGEQIESGTPLDEGPLAPGAARPARRDGDRPLPRGRGAGGHTSQGVEIHDKHIELIVRQMLKKVRIDSAATRTCCCRASCVDKLRRRGGGASG